MGNGASMTNFGLDGLPLSVFPILLFSPLINVHAKVICTICFELTGIGAEWGGGGGGGG